MKSKWILMTSFATALSMAVPGMAQVRRKDHWSGQVQHQGEGRRSGSSTDGKEIADAKAKNGVGNRKSTPPASRLSGCGRIYLPARVRTFRSVEGSISQPTATQGAPDSSWGQSPV